MPAGHPGISDDDLRSLVQLLEALKAERQSLLARNPEWGAETDARPCALARCVNALDVIILCGIHECYNLTSADWWRRHINAALTPQQCALRTAAFDSFLVQTAHTTLFSAIEHTIRVFLRALCPGACQNGRAQFGSVYSKLLAELDLAQWKPLLEVWGDIRNAIHNNGQFLPSKAKSADITVKGRASKRAFCYNDGDHFSASWGTFIWFAARGKEMLVDIVNSRRITGIAAISDPWPVSPEAMREGAARFMRDL